MALQKQFQFDYDCAVIGGGPGGLVSTLYLSRFKRKVILIDAGDPRAQWIPRIRNLIGHTKGLTGPQLLDHLKEQVSQYPVKQVKGEARLYRRQGGFNVKVGGRTFSVRKAILATGMRDLQPSLPNIEPLREKGVLAYCPICDGFEHSKEHVGLLVQDNHGLKKMQFLHQFSRRISIFQVRPFPVSSQNRKLAAQLGIHIHEGQLLQMEYRARPKGLRLRMTGRNHPFEVDVAYVALGVQFAETAIQHLKGLRRTREGFIVTRSHQETSIHGLFAVGDCVNSLAQVSVAVGQAALAATRIHNELGFSL